MQRPAYVDELLQYLNIAAFGVWDQSDKAGLGWDCICEMTIRRWMEMGFMLCFPPVPAEEKLHVIRDKSGCRLAPS